MSDNKPKNTISQQSFFIINQKTIIQGFFLGLLSFLVVIVLFAVWGGLMLNNKYQLFLFFSKMSHQDLVSLAKTIQPKKYKNSQVNFLILGTDETENRPDFPQLTDSIILAQLDTSTAQLTTLGLPRDLWIEPYKTKINALYEYGKERYPDQPQQFPAEVISEMTQLNLDHTLVLSMEQIAGLVELVGGVLINVENGFIDDQFPRNDVDIQVEHDPEKLYETVEFAPGPNLMNGETVLKYIRSRHSQDLTEGNDLARSQRQQQVLMAIINKLSQPDLHWKHPEVTGSLVKFYQDNYGDFLPLDQVISMVLAMGKKVTQLQFNSLTLAEYPENPEGLIEHPLALRPYQNQWVYLVKDLSAFQQFIKQSFNN